MDNNKLLESLSSFPYHIHIVLTTRCNLRCAHCYGSFGEPDNKELSLVAWKKIIREVKKENTLYLNLSGGEPTTYPKFLEIIKYLDKMEQPFFLTTNGMISEKTQKALLKSHVLMGVKISLDGITPEKYLLVRDPVYKRKQLFEKVLNTIENFDRNGVYIAIGVLINQQNTAEIQEFPRFLSRYPNVKKLVIGPLIQKGRGCSSKEGLVGPDLISSLKDEAYWDKLKKNCERFGIELSATDDKIYTDNKRVVFECGAGIHFMSIFADGNAYPCPLLSFTSLGKNYSSSVVKNGIKGAWFSNQFKLWRSQQVYGCYGCKSQNKCGRCPVQLDLANESNPYASIEKCFEG